MGKGQIKGQSQALPRHRARDFRRLSGHPGAPGKPFLGRSDPRLSRIGSGIYNLAGVGFSVGTGTNGLLISSARAGRQLGFPGGDAPRDLMSTRMWTCPPSESRALPLKSLESLEERTGGKIATSSFCPSCRASGRPAFRVFPRIGTADRQSGTGGKYGHGTDRGIPRKTEPQSHLR